eukprot:gene8159-14088_t
MNVSTRNTILLQTAHAKVKVPGLRRDEAEKSVRSVFDLGSQKSYITKELKRLLQLPVIGKDRLSIKTFGDSKLKVRECEIVKISVKCKDGTELVISAYVVPFICTAISNQRIPEVVQRYP